MSKSYLNRREFIKLSGAAAVAAYISLSCDGGGGTQTDTPGSVSVFKLSLRGRRGSNAAKIHNANKLFLTPAAADANRAHPGDNSRIVSITLSEERFNELFNGGSLEMVDLRDL